MRRSEADTGNGRDDQLEHGEVGRTIFAQLALTNASALEARPSPLVSKRGLPVMGTLQADVVAAQSPSIPTLSVHALPLLRRHLRPRRRDHRCL